MIIVGYILLVFGVVASIIGEVMFLTVAYKRSLLWFFGCLFIPIVAWIFFFLNMKTTIKPFAMAWLGAIAAFYGAYVAGINLH